MGVKKVYKQLQTMDIDDVEMLDLSDDELAELMYEREKVKVEILKEFTPSSLKAKSEVTVLERYNFARLELLSSPFKNIEYDNKFLRKFIENYLEYGISLNRQGRKETKEVIQSFYNAMAMEEQQLTEQREEDIKEKLRRLLLT